MARFRSDTFARMLLVATSIGTLGAALSTGASAARAQPEVEASGYGNRCAAFRTQMQGHWPDHTTRITALSYVPLGKAPAPDPRQFHYDANAILKAHCDLQAVMAERTGVDGQHYAIKFHLRLPLDWNGRFLFQGGGGTNGDVGNAIGATAGVGLSVPALTQGYAVVSQDSGHDNAVNTDPAKGGAAAFGHDPEARRNYAYASLKAVTDAAKAAIGVFYARAPLYSYFAGCSKGGQEGMAIAHRYPHEFNGIVAAAPGMSLPRAALAQTWDARAFGRLLPTSATGMPAFDTFPGVFSRSDFDLVRTVVLKACDAADGLADGIVSRYGTCTDAVVLPVLRAATCTGAKTAQCLSREQVDTLRQSLAGPRHRNGAPIYASFPWDGGIGQPGWAVWKVGLAEGVPPLSVVVGGPALATIFQTPPEPLSPDPRDILRWQMAFDFDGNADAIYRHAPPFQESGWETMSARSDDIDGFRAAGGKLIVPQGAADPVFSLNDTLQWYRDVDRRFHGGAATTVRVFPVPGMNHCEGGPATDQTNAFAALVAWVEHGRAPDQLDGSASQSSPWPGRKRPICRFPKYARYDRHGDIEKEGSFTCAI